MSNCSAISSKLFLIQLPRLFPVFSVTVGNPDHAEWGDCGGGGRLYATFGESENLLPCEYLFMIMNNCLIKKFFHQIKIKSLKIVEIVNVSIRNKLWLKYFIQLHFMYMCRHLVFMGPFFFFDC